MPKRIQFNDTQIKDIINRYESGESALSIGRVYNVSNKTIQRLLEKHNIKNRGNRKHFYKEDIFKKIDTAEKAYWIGFITADGYINEERGFMRIKLQECDRPHLSKFVKFIKGDEGMIKHEHHNITGNKQYYVEVNGKNFIDSLVALGIRQKKSTNEKWCEQIPEKYIKDYIRGIVDGDGHIELSRMDICNSYEVLSKIQEYLIPICYITKGKITDHSNTNRIYICKNLDLVLEHLYYKKCVSLDRKQNIAKMVAMYKSSKIGSDSLNK